MKEDKHSKLQNAMYMMACAGLVLSFTIGVCTDDPWMFLWFLFSVALGNIAGESGKT